MLVFAIKTTVDVDLPTSRATVYTLNKRFASITISTKCRAQ